MQIEFDLGKRDITLTSRGLDFARAEELFMGRHFTAEDTREDYSELPYITVGKLSMDGRGAWRDNVFVERLWRSVKYERVYLKAYDGVSAARADIADYMAWYNVKRPHSRLERLTPLEKYLNTLLPIKQAA